MKNTHFNAVPPPPGDILAACLRESQDNRLQLERLKRNLLHASQSELTPRQREFLFLYYEQGYSMTQIAKLCGISCSTVSRTLQRARVRLQHVLQYTF